ncbi:hypothetical protein Goari_002918 [Gossypium aridum]|uniref:Uncharacterized protein n=1 Tax=Gossypium aridum TaxID=34290 RepID=A0A7J8Y9W3_GOSAI|nr:hypothetical protein [Gossypium aridum]
MIFVTMDKKIAYISSMHAPMEEDVPFSFPLRYGPNQQLVKLGNPQGIHEPVHVASQDMVYGLYCSILEP